MNPNLKIAVADDEPRMRDYYREVLSRMGHQVSIAASTGRELVEGCRVNRPDLILTDVKMPDLDGIDASIEIARGEPIPVILVSAYHDDELLERTRGGLIFAFLVKPIKHDDLKTAITVAIQRFAEFKTLRGEAIELRQALDDRKVIERAKGVLMKKAGLDEEDAFKRLRRLARDGNHKLVEVARMILKAEAAFEPPTASV